LRGWCACVAALRGDICHSLTLLCVCAQHLTPFACVLVLCVVAAVRPLSPQVASEGMGGLAVILPPVPVLHSDKLYIFVDNSNMHIGAQRVHSTASGGAEGSTVSVVHLAYKQLMSRVVFEREVAKRFVAGVMPDAVARNWREQGFAVKSGAAVGSGCAARCSCVEMCPDFKPWLGFARGGAGLGWAVRCLDPPPPLHRLRPVSLCRTKRSPTLMNFCMRKYWTRSRVHQSQGCWCYSPVTATSTGVRHGECALPVARMLRGGGGRRYSDGGATQEGGRSSWAPPTEQELPRTRRVFSASAGASPAALNGFFPLGRAPTPPLVARPVLVSQVRRVRAAERVAC
jgi:hypothetical protein